MFLASRLLLMSPRPWQATASLDLDFGRRHAQGEPSASIEADPALAAARECAKILVIALSSFPSVVIAAVSIGMELLLRSFQKAIVPWQGHE